MMVSLPLVSVLGGTWQVSCSNDIKSVSNNGQGMLSALYASHPCILTSLVTVFGGSGTPRSSFLSKRGRLQIQWQDPKAHAVKCCTAFWRQVAPHLKL